MILVVLLLVCELSLAQEGTTQPRKPRSLVQACRKEVRSLCPGSMKSLNACMQQKVSQISDETCKTWVQASAACDGAVSGNAKCGEKETPRQCLRKLQKSDLPEECTSTDYYQSIRMTARRFPPRPIQTKS